MKVAAVDIGTNTVRLLLADATGDAGEVSFDNIVRREVITKLGEGLDASGRLGEAPMQRALDGLAAYATEIGAAGGAAVGGVATAATRSAANGTEFIRRVAETLGFMPRIIDGVEEARLTFLGATAHLDPSEIYCVIDVGGGSTEFVTGRHFPEYAMSIDIGSVRLTERVESMRLRAVDDIRGYVDDLFSRVRPPDKPTLVLGSGGTFVTLAAVARNLLPGDVETMGDLAISMSEMVAAVDRLAAMTVEEIAALPAVVPARAAVLQAGVICAERAAAHMGAESVRISVQDILDGVATELATGEWPAARL